MPRERIQQAGAVAYRRLPSGPVFLLVTSRRDPSKWIFPKGHIERGEDAATAAIRELAEEAGTTGRVVAPLGTLAFQSGSEGVDVLYFLVEALDEGAGQEGRQLRWLPLRDAAGLISHDDARALLDAARLQLGA